MLVHISYHVVGVGYLWNFAHEFAPFVNKKFVQAIVYVVQQTNASVTSKCTFFIFSYWFMIILIIIESCQET